MRHVDVLRSENVLYIGGKRVGGALKISSLDTRDRTVATNGVDGVIKRTNL